VTGASGSGAEVWAEFVAHAGLDVDTPYDAAVVDDVAVRLTLPVGSDMQARINARGSSTTDVLVAVLGAMRPWAMMMRDLLTMMRSAGAKKTKTQLRAHIDIAQPSIELAELDLEHFTEGVQSYRTLANLVARRSWSTEDLGKLWNVLPWDPPEAPPPEDAQSWLDHYETHAQENRASASAWLPAPEPPALTGHDQLDDAIASTYDAWSSALGRMTAVSRTRLELFELSKLPDTPLDDELKRLAQFEHDRWSEAVLRRLHVLASHVAGGRWHWEEWHGTGSPQQLIDLVATLEKVDAPVDASDGLERLLSLPVWQRRYDLYSNWVFTQIVAALEDAGLVVHAPDGRMDFAFTATCMASVPHADPPLEVYSELRSPLRGPSVKRKNEVQPDYSILVGDPADPAQASVVEVECKQYAGANPSNFGSALHDYALARPEALVTLVNYGPISKRARASTMAKVAPALHPRCRIIAELQPQSGDALTNFRAALHDAVRTQAPELFDTRLDTTQTAVIELHWSDGGDLDLHLAIECQGSPITIDYTNRNEDRGDPFAWLIEDITQGPGPEVVQIEKWLPVIYTLRVHHFNDRDLAGSAPTILIKSGELTIEHCCPSGSGTWWDVAEIDGATGRIEELGRLRG
jgi:hypothetical protein